MIYENFIVLDDQEYKFIDNVVNGSTFPLYCNVIDDSWESTFRAVMHVLMNRCDEEKQGIPNSNYYKIFENIFLRFCERSGIPVNTIYRAAVNFTTYSSHSHTPIHVDHDFPHKVFIGYLNNVDGGETLIFNERNEVEYEIKPEKFKGLIFDSQPHAIKFCGDQQVRVVLVFTFN